MNDKKFLLIISLIVAVQRSFASYFDGGNKPLSLASAYTAVNGDIYSIYSNPAGLYNGNKFDLKLDILGGINFTGDILYNINQIISVAEKYEKIRYAQQQGGYVDITHLSALFNGIKNLVEIGQPGKGILSLINGGIGIKIKNFAFSVRNFTKVGLKPVVDNSFSLGELSVNTTPLLPNMQSVYLSNSNSTGIVITTDTLTTSDTDLIFARDKLTTEVLPWLIPELKHLGVEIPPEVENNFEGIANALINLAIQNKTDKVEIINAVNQLANKELQLFISNFINNLLQQQIHAFNENSSGLRCKGVNYTEVSFGYSYPVIDRLFIGSRLRVLIGKTLYYDIKVFQQKEQLEVNTLSKIVAEQLEKSYTTAGLDIGLIYKIPLPLIDTNFGVVVNNVVEPQFDFKDTKEKLIFNRQLKTGISGKLLKVILFAVDYDLNKIDTLIPGYEIQNLAIGIEVNLPV
ncbi:MAG: conjugal transfer protein TraF, partial [Endomicrobia bacterium]|nr:conjugal transfer protein TraF [Endomicrobiia bacterium]